MYVVMYYSRITAASPWRLRTVSPVCDAEKAEDLADKYNVRFIEGYTEGGWLKQPNLRMALIDDHDPLYRSDVEDINTLY